MIIAFLTGILLGVIFFGGLYLSIDYMKKVKYPGAFMGASMFIRTALVIVGMLLIRGDSYYNMPLALIGIIIVRIFMTTWVKRGKAVKNVYRS
ncbi:ATP synthase subunit I [Alkalibacter mobilis]|uniref:ATP synthase subunit I n=1 Tax=Alkalibacter mobilis TaxID=2787712 RepID=UPI001CEC4C4B|nr:ATP synthase subunit I [Alkalibacter mobilis]